MTTEEYERKRSGKLLRKFIDMHFANYKDFAHTLDSSQSCVSNWICGRVLTPKRIILRLGELFPDELSILKKIKPEIF